MQAKFLFHIHCTFCHSQVFNQWKSLELTLIRTKLKEHCINCMSSACLGIFKLFIYSQPFHLIPNVRYYREHEVFIFHFTHLSFLGLWCNTCSSWDSSSTV